MREGDEITITAGELVAGGDAIARIDGFPVFASNVFPGDVAVVRLYEVKKGFAKADLVRIVEPSPLRRAMPCPIANECGGCDWTALRLDAQLAAKERILRESLRRIGKLAEIPPIAIHPSPLNYRLRSRLHREGDAVGFYAMRSNRVVPLARECEVVGVETARHPVEGETWEVGGGMLTGEQELTLRVDGFRFPVAGFRTSSDAALPDGNRKPETGNRQPSPSFTWRLNTRAFFQVNRHLLGTMIERVLALAGETRQRRLALDLYAGVGFFTLPLATLFERVVAVEGSPVSARYAKLNAPRNVQVLESAVETARLPEADLVFLDPPRAGAKREVIAAAGAKARERIVYLSCDPVTFSRDANRLTADGWRLATLDLLDLFPNTHHVETLGSFQRV